MQRGRSSYRAIVAAVLLGWQSASIGALPSSGNDLIVLLDLSQSVIPYFQGVADYVVSPLARDYLRLGDSFHLLSFGEAARVEAASAIREPRDLKRILGRLYLLAPLEKSTDLVGAITFLRSYAEGLPPERPKDILIITDGVHSPAAGSGTVGLSPEMLQDKIKAEAGAIRAHGWKVYIIKLPLGAGDPARTAANPGESTLAGTGAIPTGQGGSNSLATGSVPRGTDVVRLAPSSGLRGTGDSPRIGVQNGSGAAASSQAPANLAGESLPRSPSKAPAPSAPISQLPSPGAPASSLPEQRLPSTLPPLPAQQAPLPQAPPRAGETGTSSAPPPVAREQGINAKTEMAASASEPSASPASEDLLEGAAEASGAAISDYDPALPGGGLTSSPILPQIQFPGQLGRRDRRFSFDLIANNPGPRRLDLRLESLTWKGLNLLAQTEELSLGPKSRGRMRISVELPSTLPAGRQQMMVELGFADGVRTIPGAGILDLEVIPGLDAARRRLGILAVFGIAFLGVGLALFILIVRRLAERQTGATVAAAVRTSAGRKTHALEKQEERTAAQRAGLGKGIPPTRSKSPNLLPLLAPRPRREGSALSSRARKSLKPPREEASSLPSPSYTPRVVAEGHTAIELRVSGQNHHVGMRNVHELRAGGWKSVGGKRSDFLIFLVPVPPRAAELHFDGRRLVFVPRRPELFPTLDKPIEDCLGLEIPMLTPRGFPLTLRFSAFVPPAERINRLLHCIETPGRFEHEADY